MLFRKRAIHQISQRIQYSTLFQRLVRYYHRYDLENAWRPLVPMGGMGLVALVFLAYFLSVRTLIGVRWCNSENDDCFKAKDPNQACVRKSCTWIYLHDFLVVYFFCMIIYHYTIACFTSPGVALPDSGLSKPWSSWKGQGGILGCNVVCNPVLERKRVALYPDHGVEDSTKTQQDDGGSVASHQQVVYIPSPNASYCKQCQIVRPPRCHHSTVFQHCVLQYDHYCIWVNNAIGYNNYRSFLLLVFFLANACSYGVVMLWRPFYQPIRESILELGFITFLKTHFGHLLIDLPMPLQLLQMIASGSVPVKVLVDLLFPLVLSLSIILGIFFKAHLRLILNARTTTEDSKICLHRSVHTYRRQQGLPYEAMDSVNPFDQGSSLANMKQVLGHNLLWCLLPVRFDPPPPSLPNNDKSK